MIKLQNIDKQYDEKQIFKNISYEFQAGKSYAIIGASGSGKSTLLNIIGMLEGYDDGILEIDNIKNPKIETKKVNYY